MSRTARDGTFAAFGLAALVFLAYWPARHGGFIWDDWQVYIANNTLLRLPDGLYRFWFTTEPHDYYPLAYSMFWLEFRLWGLDTLGYHLVNFALHAGTSIVLWRLLRAMKLPAAWFVAAVFALHPVNVESVAWIAQRKTLLGGFFGLAAWLFYIRFATKGSFLDYITSLVFFLLSLSGKPVFIALPFILLGWRWWAKLPTARRDLVLLLPFVGESLLMGAVGTWFQSARALGGGAVRSESLAAKIAIAGDAAWFYIFKTLVPLNLSFVYPRWSIDSKNLLSYVPTLALLLLLVAAWWFRNTWGRPLLAGLGGFLLSVAPSLGLIDVYYWRYSLVGDHYQYQAIPFTIALVVGCLMVLASRRTVDTPAKPRPEDTTANRRAKRGAQVTRPSRSPLLETPTPLLAFGCVTLLALFALTWRQSRLYVNEEPLWRDTLSKNPSAWLAHTNLGNILFRSNRFEEAIPHYFELIKLHPDALAYSNLASCLASVGRVDEAIEQWRNALKLDPNYPDVRRNLAIAYQKQQRWDEARATWEEILSRNPKDEEARAAVEQLGGQRPPGPKIQQR